MNLRDVYYFLKPITPRRVQIYIRRKLANFKRPLYENIWPINESAATPPENWQGWPEQKKFALVLTHDVETAEGQNKAFALMLMEKELGFCSSFNFVPERYQVSDILRHELEKNGFEVGVHGLNHDGKLYQSEIVFKERAKKINHYLKEWGARGFRSPVMHHNLDWLHELDIAYDASTFDTAPFEPQPDGVNTIFPFWVQKNSSDDGYVELPYTLEQDFTIFILLQETSINVWKTKLDWIVQKGGMALLNTHPDYMNFTGIRLKVDEYPATYYQEFLEYVKTRYAGQYWHALPKELAHFWKTRQFHQELSLR